MKILKTAHDFKFKKDKSLGFVPTMGALHEGHGVLISKSKEENEQTCVSIFVNPTQFNKSEDFNTYPKRMVEDLNFCRELGVDFVFAPDVPSIYIGNESIELVESDISNGFEGEHRPGHFKGVLQVVMKLLNIVEPNKAYFGEKDYQQFLLIKKMSEEFFMKTHIVGIPTARDEYGLALSSRNYNLSEAGISKAREIAAVFLKTSSKEEFLSKVSNDINLEYYGEKWNRALIAHYVEGVRLIDNKALRGDE